MNAWAKFHYAHVARYWLIDYYRSNNYKDQEYTWYHNSLLYKHCKCHAHAGDEKWLAETKTSRRYRE